MPNLQFVKPRLSTQSSQMSGPSSQRGEKLGERREEHATVCAYA
ncbi:hypothetical protein EmuJ_000778800 [Echinococcus multilocularis]|uniref:Uncharacterized protein n=2 Tax=Echinococcus TaxID=6209 RepID=A0A068WCR6_ECHGR|nr:hypothetical protein EgrG_000778800 [Echinococcus granulosus]CDS40220.1 hypothetical protein EmuJ_000778800 [Echinococcus multilocularis]